jgi:hypothetical protein
MENNRGVRQSMKYPCLLVKKINEISPAKYNPRKISDEAMGRLTKSLAEFGNIQPITWNARTGNVVGGHQRLKVYQAMGKTEVDVWAVDLDEQKEKAANIALNKLAGEFDLPLLKDILQEIDTGDLDLEITGFGMEEIAEMMEMAPPENSLQEYTQKIKSPIYETTGEKPKISELFNADKTNALLDKINKSSISEEEKEFLRKAAQRHTSFNYRNIAEFYAHGNKETQELIEDSALVIIDFKKAIENGFVELTEEIAEICKDEN